MANTTVVRISILAALLMLVLLFAATFGYLPPQSSKSDALIVCPKPECPTVPQKKGKLASPSAISQSWKSQYPAYYPGLNWGVPADCPVFADYNSPSEVDRVFVHKTFLRFLKTKHPERPLVGVEIGALHRKTDVNIGPPGSVEMHYIDYLPAEKLREMYKNDLATLGTIQLPDIIADAENLKGIADEYADFYIWSHVIEHTELALKALNNSLRIIKPGGYVFVTVPDMCRSFDRHRFVTTWEHHLEEYLDESKAAKNKREHYSETALSHIASLDYAKWVWAKPLPRMILSEKEIYDISEHLVQRNYSIHYHTWTISALHQFFVNAKEELGMKFDMIFFQREHMDMIAVLERK